MPHIPSPADVAPMSDREKAAAGASLRSSCWSSGNGRANTKRWKPDGGPGGIVEHAGFAQRESEGDGPAPLRGAGSCVTDREDRREDRRPREEAR